MEKVTARNNRWTKQRKADAQEEPKRNARNWSTVAETADAWAGRGCVKTLLCREKDREEPRAWGRLQRFTASEPAEPHPGAQEHPAGHGPSKSHVAFKLHNIQDRKKQLPGERGETCAREQEENGAKH